MAKKKAKKTYGSTGNSSLPAKGVGKAAIDARKKAQADAQKNKRKSVATPVTKKKTTKKKATKPKSIYSRGRKNFVNGSS